MQLFVPLTLKKRMLAEMGLNAHAEPFHHAGRRLIAGIAAGKNPMKAKFAKAELNGGVDGLGGVTLSTEGGVEYEAEFGLAGRCVVPSQGHMTDQLPITFADDGQRQCIARTAQGHLMAENVERGIALGKVARLPVQVALNLR